MLLVNDCESRKISECKVTLKLNSEKMKQNDLTLILNAFNNRFMGNKIAQVVHYMNIITITASDTGIITNGVLLRNTYNTIYKH